MGINRTTICVLTLFFIVMFVSVSKAEQMCDDIFPPAHGKLTMERHNMYYIVRCEPGYVIEGNYFVRCKDGEWGSLPPKCVADPMAKKCPEIEPLENGNATCPEGPQFVGSHCRFSCHEGYELKGLVLRICLRGTRWSGFQPRCIPITNQSCPVPPPLTNGRVISCSPRKSPPTVGRTCHFRCNPGYVLQGPSALYCQSTGKLTDVFGQESFPECIAVKPEPRSLSDGQNTVSQPEENRQRIDSEAGGPDYRLPTTSRPIHNRYDYNFRTTSRPAQPVHGFQQVSRPIHRTDRNSYSSESGKETASSPVYSSCEDNNGGCQHDCRLTRRGLVKCHCWHGYILTSDRRSCVDIDECATEAGSRCQHDCHNSPGSFTCSCRQGYHQTSAYKCEGCKKDSYWSDEANQCLECPDHSYTDSEGKLSIDDCHCFPGYTGNPRENIPCKDIDECADNNYGCSHECVNIPGSAFCSCPIGYTLDANNKTCIDMNECDIKNGGCQGICHNTEGSFYCSCPDGYTSSNKDIYSCDDVNECLENNGGCAQKCNNYPGGHFCSCADGYRIDSGLQNCTDIRCPSIPLPHYSSMTCSIRKADLPQLESYPVGAVCIFDCAKGFKIKGSSNKIKCLEDGSWTGRAPECKSQRCEALPVPENGEIHPPSCSKKGNTVKQKCTFTCHPGYKLNGMPVFQCRNNLTWSVQKIPECQPEKIRPTIACPADISVDLLPGTRTRNITLSSPVTNAVKVLIKPEWVSTGSPTEFPAGTTNVVFKASVPNVKRFARCTTTVSVIDREAPVFLSCPDSIEIEDVGASGVPVTWIEPIATDNVGVESVTSSVRPNSTLVPGTYTVEYFAKDAAGNSDSCTFKILLKRTQCDDLPDPENGDANCMHWTSGKLCNPTCNDGYERHPNDTAFYFCDDSGVWEPSDVISKCLKTLPLTSLECPGGYEMIESSEMGDKICIECQAHTFWSSSTRKCEIQEETE